MNRVADFPSPFPFIVGCGRSGTTLLAVMLDSHPDVAVPGETGGFILRLCESERASKSRGDRAGDPYGRATIELMVDELATSHRFLAWDLDRASLIETLCMQEVNDRSDIVRGCYLHYARTRRKSRYADKTPNHVLSMERLAEHFPEAVFLHVIRDGRDVALSIREMSWGPSAIPELAAYWSERVTAGRKAGRALGPERYREIWYASLVAEPAVVLGGLAPFLGVAFDPVMLDYRQATRRQLAMSPAPEEDRSLSLPPTPGLRDWREQMGREELAAFEAVAGEVLTEFGYEVAT